MYMTAIYVIISNPICHWQDLYELLMNFILELLTHSSRSLSAWCSSRCSSCLPGRSPSIAFQMQLWLIGDINWDFCALWVTGDLVKLFSYVSGDLWDSRKSLHFSAGFHLNPAAEYEALPVGRSGKWLILACSITPRSLAVPKIHSVVSGVMSIQNHLPIFSATRLHTIIKKYI